MPSTRSALRTVDAPIGFHSGAAPFSSSSLRHTSSVPARTLRALRGLWRGCTVLERLVADAVRAGNKAQARDLRSVLTAVERGAAHISGGFVINEIEPEAKKWAKAK